MSPKSHLSILFPWQEEVEYRPLPETAWHDLGLDVLTEKIAAQPQEVPLIRRVMTSLTPDPRVSAFRADVFEDLLAHPEIRNRLMKLLEQVKTFYDYGVTVRPNDRDDSLWDLLHRLEEYHDYIITVEEIRECLSDASLSSRGLVQLKETVDGIYAENGFAALKKERNILDFSDMEHFALKILNYDDTFMSEHLEGIAEIPEFNRVGTLKYRAVCNLLEFALGARCWLLYWSCYYRSIIELVNSVYLARLRLVAITVNRGHSIVHSLWHEGREIACAHYGDVTCITSIDREVCGRIHVICKVWTVRIVTSWLP